MQAVVVSEGKAVLRSVSAPSPATGQVRVRLHAAGVNPIDWKMALGYRPGAPAAPGGVAPSSPVASAAPWTPGFDAAGVIESLGPQVQGWKVGDPVIVFIEPRGAYAEYAVVPVSTIARKPEKLSFEQAAGIPTTASAAWAVLVDSAKVSKGQRVLIHGGAGGVGSAAVQIAKSRGAYVIATASKRNHEYLRSIGADEVIDYQTERFEDRVRDVDIAVNTVNPETATRSIAVVKKGGLVVSVAGPADAAQCAAANVRCLMRSRDGTPIGTVLNEVAQLAAAGKYDVNVDATFPLADFEKAWAASKAGHTRGKLILTLR
ncbi:NADP-dependent oxidoreductase [Steroidobacter sp.]|uniref:NADP-dependent oxidoreductase n=1 Tax=Steroidobacter sp. TaxID=1978227 RepID=UPI0025FAD7EF|nr:NADP-dependent oxidoreductase [Steroidobacter sp.]